MTHAGHCRVGLITCLRNVPSLLLLLSCLLSPVAVTSPYCPYMSPTVQAYFIFGTRHFSFWGRARPTLWTQDTWGNHHAHMNVWLIESTSQASGQPLLGIQILVQRQSNVPAWEDCAHSGLYGAQHYIKSVKNVIQWHSYHGIMLDLITECGDCIALTPMY